MHDSRGVGSLGRKIRARWEELSRAEPGTRFQRFHDEQGGKASPWMRALYVAVAAVSFVVGVVFALIPGPAIPFFAMSAALLAAQSAWVARRLDGVEIWVRRFFRH